MKFPDGCVERSGIVVKRERTLDRMKQAYRQWSVLLCTTFIDKSDMGQCRTDPCMFRKI